VTLDRFNQPLTPQLHLPAYVYLTIPLAVLAAPLELALRGCPGQIGFVLMLVPTVMAAFDGGVRSTLITGLAGAVGLSGAAWLAQRVTGDRAVTALQLGLPVFWGAALVGCGVWLARGLEVVRRHAAKLQDQCDQHERSIYKLYKDSSEVAAAHEEERLKRQQDEAQRVDFSRLLLNIQHLGRELCGKLQMSAVLQLVTDAAKKLLKAPNPRIFLLDELGRELVEHTPGSAANRRLVNRGMLGWAVRHGQIITAEDVARNHALADLRSEDTVEWQACAPLVFGQKVLGVLGIDALEQRNQEFDRLLYIVANFCAVAVNNGRMFEQAAEMAQRDGLTGLLNHATFQSRWAEFVAEAKHSGRPVSLVMSDVDHFKQFNDRFGHQAGDFVLRSVADLWKQLIPSSAVAARYGGEEFVCVLPGIGLDEASHYADSLRFALENAAIEFEGTALRVTASFGVAAFPASGDSATVVLREADAALYAAKRGGRNRVCVATADDDRVPEHAAATIAST
jgi:diguanylate cyclase (GGDEF)-like protein